MMIACLRIVSLALALMASASGRADTGGAAGITDLLHGMFDKPGVTLTISPVVVSGDHAIAQGDMGGRALLRRKQGAWVVTLCAGDAIKSSEALKTAGVPEPDAIKLAQDLAAAESRLAPEQVAMFSRFEGLVTIDGAPVTPTATSSIQDNCRRQAKNSTATD